MSKKKKLFIVESPTKVKTVKKYLGSDYEVCASVGHCYRLPLKNYVDYKTFELKYEPDPRKKDALKNIVSLAEKCDEILLATDQDVEGSVIAHHLYIHLYKKYKNKKIYTRVNLKEITKSGIQQALKSTYPITNPKEQHIVEAGFLRRAEDRFVGFKISPLANIYVQEKTSAGRVQSPALRLVVEREREIENFVPIVYYEVFSKIFPTGTKEVFTAKYAKEIKEQKVADTIVKQCKGQTPVISKITKKQTQSRPNAPFITKTLLQAASTILGWKAKKATAVAQSLFQLGAITYIRTDNPVISADGQKILKDYVKANFSSQYIPQKLTNYNNAKAKLEHECIRPTNLDPSAQPSLPSDEKKLYELIKARFIAAGMTPALYDSVSAEIKIGPHPFKAQGSTQTFDGHLKVWTFTKRADTTLPALTQKTNLSLRDIYSERKETKPPSRYKGASLIDALDKMGIGKPSTMNSILDTLESRDYIRYNKQAIQPTDLGKRLNDFLCEYFLEAVDYDLTAKVEEEQEKVMLGQLKYEDVISTFYKNLKKVLTASSIKINKDKKDSEQTTIICPKCNTNLLMRKLNRKDSTYFYSCSGYQDKSCVATFSIGKDNEPVESKIEQEILQECPRKGCGGSLVKRMNKKTKQVFYACSNWKEKKCKVTADADGNIKVPKKLKKHGKCDKCKTGNMVERTSRAGAKFLACDNFPKCKNTKSLEEK